LLLDNTLVQRMEGDPAAGRRTQRAQPLGISLRNQTRCGGALFRPAPLQGKPRPSIPELPTINDATMVAKKLLNTINADYVISGQKLSIRPSMGIRVSPPQPGFS